MSVRTGALISVKINKYRLNKDFLLKTKNG